MTAKAYKARIHIMTADGSTLCKTTGKNPDKTTVLTSATCTSCRYKAGLHRTRNG